MKYEALFCQLRDVNNIPRFLNAECRFFFFFFFLRVGTDKKKSLMARPYKQYMSLINCFYVLLLAQARGSAHLHKKA